VNPGSGSHATSSPISPSANETSSLRSTAFPSAVSGSCSSRKASFSAPATNSRAEGSQSASAHHSRRKRKDGKRAERCAISGRGGECDVVKQMASPFRRSSVSHVLLDPQCSSSQARARCHQGSCHSFHRSRRRNHHAMMGDLPWLLSWRKKLSSGGLSLMRSKSIPSEQPCAFTSAGVGVSRAKQRSMSCRGPTRDKRELQAFGMRLARIKSQGVAQVEHDSGHQYMRSHPALSGVTSSLLCVAPSFSLSLLGVRWGGSPPARAAVAAVSLCLPQQHTPHLEQTRGTLQHTGRKIDSNNTGISC